MAIRIPSKNIYGSPQNPKVRDNVIERIEVMAVEVVPDNDFNTAVYNEDILLKQNSSTTETNPQKEKLDYDIQNDPIAPSIVNRYWAYAFLDSNSEYYVGEIKIPRLKNNKYISTVNYGTDKWKIESNLVLSKTTYPISGEINVKDYDEITSKNITQSDGVSEIVYNFPNMPSTVKKEQGGAKAELTGVSNNTNLAVSYEENEGSFTISYKILKKLVETKYVGAIMSQSSSDVSIPVNGEKTEYNAEKIEITIYGNTIGIDLTDKTVYIPETDKTSKKVFRVEGNELMQTTNYIAEPSRNALQEDFGKTKEQYAKGKETATIRCSISNYYDYDSGDKLIAIDKSTKKMSFVESDQVIPMVYGADGQDHPMSLNKDGSPKVFSVLGTKKYYNGAVWQELYLQET